MGSVSGLLTAWVLSMDMAGGLALGAAAGLLIGITLGGLLVLVTEERDQSVPGTPQ